MFGALGVVDVTGVGVVLGLRNQLRKSAPSTLPKISSSNKIDNNADFFIFEVEKQNVSRCKADYRLISTKPTGQLIHLAGISILQIIDYLYD